MAHRIETFGERAAFASARVPAWHRLGTVVPEAMTVAEALKTSHLADWRVRTTPLRAELPDGRVADVPDRHLVMRDHPVTGQADPLGTVGGRYRPIQNEQALAFLDDLIDDGGAHWETAGSLDGGRRIFATLKMPAHVTVAGGDRTEVFLLVTNPHDGTGSMVAAVTPVRVVCANTLSMALAGKPAQWRVRHTESGPSRLAEARRALGLTLGYVEAFQAQADALAARELSPAGLDGVLDTIWPTPKPSDTNALGRNLKLKRTIRQLRTYSPTIGDDIRPTAWGAWQAITEYVDWLSPARGGAVGRAVRQMTPDAPAAALKARAADLILAAA